jgi:hypothetical protein
MGYSPLSGVPPRTIAESSAPVNVSVLTTLYPFTDVGTHHSSLLFAVVNLSATNTLHMVIDTSEDGTHPDGTNQIVVDVAPGYQGSYEVGTLQIRKYFRLSAYTDSPAFPVASANWYIRGVAR